jgi:hypothetical protein
MSFFGCAMPALDHAQNGRVAEPLNRERPDELDLAKHNLVDGQWDLALASTQHIFERERSDMLSLRWFRNCEFQR